MSKTRGIRDRAGTAGARARVTEEPQGRRFREGGEGFARSREVELPDRKRLLWVSGFHSCCGDSWGMALRGERARQTKNSNSRAADPRSDHVERDEENSPGCFRHWLTKALTRRG